jgi:putative hydrolase of the HAD superfamily
MTGVMPIGAILCDLDGVLRRWPPVADLERQHGVPAGTLAATAFAPHLLHPAITGRHTDEEWRAAITRDLAAHTDRAQELVAAWSETAGELDHEVAEILRVARRRGPVVLVTNATTRLDSDVDRLGIGDHVDAIVNSARLGKAKPEPEIYLAAAELAGVPPARCLFVDDSPANTDAARTLGMQAHHYRSAAGLRAAIPRW